MHRALRYSGSFLLVSASATFAQSPETGEDAHAQDPDEIAADELVRELRKSTDETEATPPESGAGESSRLSIDELVRLIEEGPPPAEQDSDGDTDGEYGNDDVELPEQ